MRHIKRQPISGNVNLSIFKTNVLLILLYALKENEYLIEIQVVINLVLPQQKRVMLYDPPHISFHPFGIFVPIFVEAVFDLIVEYLELHCRQMQRTDHQHVHAKDRKEQRLDHGVVLDHGQGESAHVSWSVALHRYMTRYDEGERDSGTCSHYESDQDGIVLKFEILQDLCHYLPGIVGVYVFDVPETQPDVVKQFQYGGLLAEQVEHLPGRLERKPE